MPSLRLKTKLVIAITAMVVAIVVALAALHISEVVHRSINEVSKDTTDLASWVFAAAHDDLEVDLSSMKRINPDNPKEVAGIVQEVLQSDSDLNNLLDSVIGTSNTITDIAITDVDGRALMHTRPELFGKIVPDREDLSSLVNGGIRKQLRIIYGPPQDFEYRFPMNRDGKHFGDVRIGISTTFLRRDIQNRLNPALALSGGVILVCLVIAAALSQIALRPLTAISRRLDLLTSGQADPAEAGNERRDEYGAVSSKIERLGRQVRDVKEVFSALKENLDQMMANLQDGVMLFTSDFRAVLVSASAERFVGKPRGEMLGSEASEIFSEDTNLGRTLRQGFERRQPIGQEEIETENGRHLQISLDFIEERGERIGALLTLRDAESVHRIEDEIELSRRLSAIGRLTSGVAHEVKNPINAIVVHLEVLRQKLKETDPDARRHMDVIASEIHRLDRVVQTLVDFTRPVELRLADADLHKVVNEVVMLASPAAEQHKVTIERQSSHDALPARIDSDLVKQAILNIVINGVQAMPEGGTLRVTTRREGEGALITVRDQGAGIAPEVRDKIFNLYFTTKKGGSGIGLAMAYRVVQLHHGTLEFTSVPGRGTTFYLRFPLSETTTGAEQPRVPSEDSVSRA